MPARAALRTSTVGGVRNSGPLRWVSGTLVLAALVAGGYIHLAGLDERHGLFAGFVGGSLALLGVEWLDCGNRVALFLLRAALIHFVVACDGSGLTRILLLLIPFVGYLTFGPRVGRLLALGYGVGVLAWLTLAEPGWASDRQTVGDLLMFGVGLVFAVAMATLAVNADVDAANADALAANAEGLAAELAGTNARLAASADQVAALATAEERNRVARELHDSLGHHLTAIAIQLEKANAYRDRDAEVAARAVTDAHGSTRAALADVRRSVSALRTPIAPMLGAALPALAAQLNTDETAVECTVDGTGDRYSPQVHSVLYRAAQEGLTNALRHAGAARVQISVRFAPAEAVLTVRDDGCGLPADTAVTSGYGLAGMRERLASVGGALRLRSTPGAGTTLTATVPAE